MKIIILLIVVFAASTAVAADNLGYTINTILDNFIDGNVKDLFKVWHLLFKKEYTLDSDEAKIRFRKFKAKLAQIKAHNSQDLPYKLGLNQFSDLTREEFEKLYLTETKPEDPSKNFLTEEEEEDLTKRNLQYTEINWVKYFPAVREQKLCGSCWAFSTSGAIDGNRGIKLNAPAPYSAPQQLVDCDTSNQGCDGGYYPNAYQYVQTNGLMLDKDYTYMAARGTCKFNKNAALAKISGFKYCNNDFGTQKCSIPIVYGLLQQGPLSVSVDANQLFTDYKGGVFIGACNKSNHAVVAAGYGYDATSKLSYWLIRNSWGSWWGDKGYIKVAVNDANNNSCFITNRAYLPLVIN